MSVEIRPHPETVQYPQCHYWLDKHSRRCKRKPSKIGRSFCGNHHPKELERWRQQVQKLSQIKFHKQRSEGWFAQRETKITASSAACLLVKDDTCDPYIEEFDLWDTFEKDGKCCNKYRSKRQYYLDRCHVGEGFRGNVATRWGTMYEMVAQQIYELKHNCKVIEFGLLDHPTIDWLGASPDGITEDGIMLEIKCPYRRKITGIPPLYYWIQVQLQLEVADLEICDFEEITLVQYYNKSECYADVYYDPKTGKKSSGKTRKGEMKGAIGKIWNPKNKKEKYLYPALNDNLEEMEKEIMKLFEKKQKKGYLFIKHIYWRLAVYSVTRIHRSRTWFDSVKDRLANCWKEIVQLRSNSKALDNFILQPKLEKRDKAKQTQEIWNDLLVDLGGISNKCIILDSDDDDSTDDDSNEIQSIPISKPSQNQFLILSDTEEIEITIKRKPKRTMETKSNKTTTQFLILTDDENDTTSNINRYPKKGKTIVNFVDLSIPEKDNVLDVEGNKIDNVDELDELDELDEINGILKLDSENDKVVDMDYVSLTAENLAILTEAGIDNYPIPKDFYIL